MTHDDFATSVAGQSRCSRRRFLGGAVGAAAAAPLLGAAARLAAEQPSPATESKTPKQKIKFGLIGCGKRGGWIMRYFKEHGGYQLHAVADYFQQAADTLGEKWAVPPSRRFSGLSAYKRLIESGVEAVVAIVPPYFASHHAAAAAGAGLHVYVAKPTAIDVAGCRRLEAAGKLATENSRVFLVDYQMHTDPVNQEVARRVRGGEIGSVAKIVTVGINGGRPDPARTATIENRLASQQWITDTCLGGDYIVEYDIHAIDAAVWLLGQRPTAAMGCSRIVRPDPHGDAHDVSGVVYQYANGLIHEHSGLALPTGVKDNLTCTVYGQVGNALLPYNGKATFHRRGSKPFSEEVVNLYTAGAVRNIASFYDDVSAGRCENPTVRRAVDGCLTCILGREAAIGRRRLTMEELFKEDRRLEPDLRGLKE
jgi:myo-inositol 2-dehydrogenase / D-chiro-inositol 1-dehydrogenase